MPIFGELATVLGLILCTFIEGTSVEVVGLTDALFPGISGNDSLNVWLSTLNRETTKFEVKPSQVHKKDCRFHPTGTLCCHFSDFFFQSWLRSKKQQFCIT